MSDLERANEAFKNKKFDVALALYKTIIHSMPELKDFLKYNIEKCYAALGLLPAINIDDDYAVDLHDKKIEKSGSYTKEKAVENTSYEGRVEKFEDGKLTGWVVDREEPSKIFELKVLVGGLLFCKVENNLSRGDLLRNKKSTGKGGFFIQIPNELFFDKDQGIELILPNDHLLERIKVDKVSQPSLHHYVRIPVEEKVSVIVPIYNAPDDLRVCIERLLKYTSTSVDVVLIDDASTDKRIPGILEDVKEQRNFRVFRNETNFGFTKTVNKGIKLAGNNDVVFLNSDARVTPRWLEGLKAALSTDAKIATVTPMSDRAGAFSAPKIGNENDLPDGVVEEDYAVAFRRRSLGFYPTVPTGNGFCMYVRRKCINEVGALDETAFPRGYGEENDFCMRARNAGWRNVIDDRTYVFHDRNKSFGDSKNELMVLGRRVIDERYPDFKKSISVFSESPLINLARFRASLALNDVTKKILPRGLFVISTLTGGTPQTNRDLMLAVVEEVEPWLLHCDSKVISLYKVYRNKPDELIKQYILQEKIEPLTHVSAEYDQVVASWLNDFDFSFVHIRHLAWHSLNLPRLAKQAGSKVIKSFHDYYAVCPTIKLLDNERKFCGGACTESVGDCPPELWPKDSFPMLKKSWVHNWRTKFKEAISYCDVFITTHQSVKDIIVEHLNVDEKLLHVIPHGRDFKEFHKLAQPYKKGDILKILVPGNISEPKGSRVIESLLKLDDQEKLEFHILGKAYFHFEHPRLIVHGEYKRDDFSEHVKKIRPHLGAVFSIWNETWCHTLTELWSVGLPVVVSDFPTLSMRVKESGSGLVLSHSDAKEIYKIISSISVDDIEHWVGNVIRYQLSGLKDNGSSMMAGRYLELYRSFDFVA